jgi:hypothetical protein
VLGADDLVFRQGWLVEALRVAEDGAQVIGLNDGHTDVRHYGSHFMAAVEFFRQHRGGVFIPPEYRSWWFDREICEHAQALCIYGPAPLARVEHRHPSWGTAKMDRTYEEAWSHHEYDRLIYERRQALGWPIMEMA